MVYTTRLPVSWSFYSQAKIYRWHRFGWGKLKNLPMHSSNSKWKALNYIIIPIPSRMDRFGLIISLELTKNISPIYKWFVGTKTLHNSSSPSSLCRRRQNVHMNKEWPLGLLHTIDHHLQMEQKHIWKITPVLIFFWKLVISYQEYEQGYLLKFSCSIISTYILNETAVVPVGQPKKW